MRFKPAQLELEVEDHGKGFAPAAGQTGIGLVAMRERAEILGGTLTRHARGQPAERWCICTSRAKRWNRMANKLTVLLVDDHALVRRGFRRMLEDEPSFQVVGEASDGAGSGEARGRIAPRRDRDGLRAAANEWN